MQVVKNYFLLWDWIFIWKFNEIFLVFQIECELDKNWIFEFYFNKIYFGNWVYGIVVVVQVYYDKLVEELLLV